ncbi:hypothetical protein Tco_1331113 [Tanacetum coccineum]
MVHVAEKVKFDEFLSGEEDEVMQNASSLTTVCARLELEATDLEELLERGDCLAQQSVDCSFTKSVGLLNLAKTVRFESVFKSMEHERWKEGVVKD